MRPKLFALLLLSLAFGTLLPVPAADKKPGKTEEQENREKKQQARQLAAQAALLENAKKYGEAAEKMASASALVPKDDTYLAHTASLYALAGKYEDSFKYADDAVQLNDKVPGHHILRMRAAVQIKNFDAAKEAAGKIVALGAARVPRDAFAEAKNLPTKLAPLEAEEFRAQAIVLHRTADYAGALAKLEAAKALSPKDKGIAAYYAMLQPLAIGTAIDQHALQAPKEAEASIDALAKYLVESAKDERSKARAIYRWETDRIAYDVEGLLAGKPGDNSAEAVLKSRKCVCAGYAKLFEQLCTHAGLTAVTINGYAKGYGYKPGDDVAKFAHAWNAVKIDDNWYLIDATWGAGHINNQQKYEKAFREHYFLAPVEDFTFDHFATDPQWQFGTTKADFEKWPKLSRDLMEMGVSAKSFLADVRSGKAPTEIVEAHSLAGPKIALQAAPIQKHPRAGEKVKFQIAAPGLEQMSVKINGKWQELTHQGILFEGEVAAQKGKLEVVGKEVRGKAVFWTILSYDVD